MKKRAFWGTLMALALCVSPLFRPDGAVSDTSTTCSPPAFVAAGAPPLVMLVMGRDHKLYYEAYNDASDLTGDGVPDVGYKPGSIDYYGYFDSNKCYVYSSTNGRFEPNSIASSKTCSGSTEWSGDFLNYLTMSRMDCLRKVLYGGYRATDSTTETVLQRAYIPQDAHTWGKEYLSVSHDGYDIRDYTPLDLPQSGTRHLFASTTLSDNGTPILRVLPNNSHRIWEWVSKEQPVADSSLVTSGGNYTGYPANHSDFNSLVAAFATSTHLMGSGTPSNGQINGTGNPYGADDYYLDVATGGIYITTAGSYSFAVDGDDAEEVLIDGNLVAGYYGGHGVCNCNTYYGTVTLSAGLHTVEFRHQEATGSDSYYLRWKGPDSGNVWQVIPAASYRGLVQAFYDVIIPASTITDYTVKVVACLSSMTEDNCTLYPSGVYKPTGLLQKYGESGRMNFGLITGSYAKNTSGGVLRKNITAFSDEINSSTGQYLTSAASRTYNTNGIISTIDKLRTYGYSYSSYSYSTNCGWITTQPMTEGQCRMWGNPIAEMMYEGLRYFAGAGATTDFIYSGTTDDSTLGLPLATWTNPYTTGGFSYCAKPFMLVISDINPTFDSDQLPGTAFGSFTGTLGSMNVETDANTISSLEITPGNFFIGESESNSPTSDSSCSAKAVTSLGNIRGLCPEDPTKKGSYYSASVAYYGLTHDLNSVQGDQKVSTYAVALASPLPRIEISVPAGSDHKVTLVPFAKSVGATSGYTIDKSLGAFQPTNTIVDFYIETLTDTYGKFRINFEDVEQGADHDMDAIVIYEYTVSGSNVTITLTSEYAAGSIIQHLGYIISGTSADGTYLEVRDYDTASTSDPDYFLDTPGSQLPYPNNTYADGAALPLNKTRTFTAGSNPPATLLTNPLWYAAKWGGFVESDSSATTPKPDTAIEWDKDGDGVPDNYFYVANPLKLYTQLDKAFLSIVSRGGSAGAVATVTQEVEGEDILVRGAFTSYEDDPKQFVWKGHLESYWPYEGCGDRSTETSCAAADCTWTSDAGCTVSCSDLTSEIACGGTLGCEWQSGRCGGSSALYNTCAEKTSTSTCETTAGCKWQSSSHCQGLIYAFQRSDQSDEFCSEHHDHCWDAAERMPTSGSRTIYTMVNGAQRSFESGNICTDADWLGLSGDSEFTTDDCTDLVNWVRGNDSWAKGRDRDGWMLGDVVYSTPLVVQAPSLSSVATPLASESCGEDVGEPCHGGCDSTNTTCVNQCFYCYRDTMGERLKMIYVGANDGMLHAFVGGVYWQDPEPEVDSDLDGTADESHFIHDPNESSSLCDGQTCTGKDMVGTELWAYIPSNLISGLKELARPTYGNESACQHRYMVDLTPQAFDVYIDPTGGSNRKWRTVILGGERGGGDVYFAIDVTDPYNPIVLWEYPFFRNLVQVTKDGSEYLASYPYLTKSIYDQVAALPASWSIPYAGYLNLDSNVSFLAADRVNSWTAGTPTPVITNRNSSNLSGWIAVIGHAPRIYSLSDLPTLSTDADEAKAQKLATLKSSLMLIDIEKGVNLMQYTWPLLQKTLSSTWPDVLSSDPSGNTYIPYSLASPTVLDIWDNTGAFSSNGIMDHIYMGDLNGNFYGLKFNLETNPNNTTEAKGIFMDVWKTKPILAADVDSNYYRSSREPITVYPAISVNEELTNLLIYFGSGKYENIQSSYNDKTDTSIMSFYALKDDVTKPTISVSATASKYSSTPTKFSISGTMTDGFKLEGVGLQVATHCSSNTYNSSCTWTTTAGAADCCEADCDSACFACLMNLNYDGERVVDSALVAGGLVFFTTFVPKSDLCSAGGDAYLYIVDYLCVPLTSDVLADSGFTSTTLANLTDTGQYAAITSGTGVAGYIAKLGSGMPSRPVLDSSGEYVIIQTSDAQIHKIKVDLNVKPMLLKGWKNEK